MASQQLRSLRIQSIFLTGALVLQYMLGMYVNLFVPFPDNATEGELWGFAWSQWPLAAHIILGVLILMGAIALVVRAVRYKDKKLIIASSIGLLSVLIASLSGAALVPSQANVYSYLMALAFLAAFVAYGWMAFETRSENNA